MRYWPPLYLMYLLNSSQVLNAGTLLKGVSRLPSCVDMFLCVPGTYKKFGAWDPNRSWDIDLPTPPCIWSTWPRFWSLALCQQMWQHLLSALEMFLCVPGTSKIFGACKHNVKWTQLNFRGAHTWPPRGLCSGTWPPGNHVLAHRGIHTCLRGLCASTWTQVGHVPAQRYALCVGATSQLLMESHGPFCLRYYIT